MSFNGIYDNSNKIKYKTFDSHRGQQGTVYTQKDTENKSAAFEVRLLQASGQGNMTHKSKIESKVGRHTTGDHNSRLR